VIFEKMRISVGIVCAFLPARKGVFYL